MKKMFFLFLPIAFMACSGVEQHRATIETISSQWDTLTAGVTELQAQVSDDLQNLSKKGGDYAIPAETLATMKPEQIAAWEAAQKSYGEAVQGYAGLRTEIAEFLKAWGSEASKVQSLKDGLAAGEIEGDVAAQVDHLNTLISQGEESLSNWKTKYDEVKKAGDQGIDTLKSAYNALTGPMAGK